MSASINKRILIISHDASRTGGPVLLLNFLKAVKQRNPSLQIETIIGWPGPLTSEFEKLGRVLELTEEKYSLPRLVWQKIKKRLGEPQPPLRRQRVARVKAFTGKVSYDLIFSNTIINGEILEALQPTKTPIISYIHELETMIRRFTTPTSLNWVLKYTSHFYTPSPAVTENLVQRYGVASTKIGSLRYYIPTSKPNKSIRAQLGISDDCFVIGAAGTSDWRKGTDLFLQIALHLKGIANKPFKFLWIGADASLADQQRVLHDLGKTGLDEHILFIGSVDNVPDYLDSLDVFALTSREDPYPLVVLEAASLKKPILCFDQSGGIVEFVKAAQNITVPYLATMAFAVALQHLMNDGNIGAMGERAYQQYQLLHSAEATLPAFEQVIGI